MNNDGTKRILQAVSVCGLLLCAALAVWGWRAGILTSQEAMEAFVARAGRAGVVLFSAFQAVQVVIPILPGGLGCLAGVVLFGPVKGFLCSYIGICIGSMLAFGVAKSCGRPLLPRLFSADTIRKYHHWTSQDSPFAAWFAAAIFFPVAPDDFLCYLAGTTDMSWQKFSAIIWLCKPFSIALYSLGLTVIWQRLLVLLP